MNRPKTKYISQACYIMRISICRLINLRLKVNPIYCRNPFLLLDRSHYYNETFSGNVIEQPCSSTDLHAQWSTGPPGTLVLNT